MKKSASPGKTPTTTVRLPPELHAQVKESAAKNGHSMNAEIIHILASFVGKPLQTVVEQNEKTHELLNKILNKLNA